VFLCTFKHTNYVWINIKETPSNKVYKHLPAQTHVRLKLFSAILQLDISQPIILRYSKISNTSYLPSSFVTYFRTTRLIHHCFRQNENSHRKGTISINCYRTSSKTCLHSFVLTFSTCITIFSLP